MTFAAPLTLLWLIPALGAIVALYLLRRPRRNLDVPSTQIWLLLPPQPVRATHWQRLTPQPLLFLQILIALLLVGAAAQPEVRQPTREGIAWAFIIDNGASMNATDEPGGRLAAAENLATTFLRADVNTNDSVVIATTAPARILATQSGASKSLPAIAPTDATSDIRSAAALAATILERQAAVNAPRRIILFTDGAWPASLDAAVSRAAGRIPLAVEPVGTAGARNIGIVRLSVQRDAANPARSVQVLTAVESYGGAGAGRLSLTVNGRTSLNAPLEAGSGESATNVYSLAAPAETAVLTARLTPATRDDLRDDDTAYTVIPAAGSTRVLLVSAGDPPLERALEILPGVRVDETRPEQYASVGAPAGYDVYVFDRVEPPVGTAAPGSILVWGGAAREFAAAAGGAGPPASSPIVDWDRSDPVLRFADLSQAKIKAPAWESVGAWQTLMQTEQGIVAASEAIGSRRAVWFSFSPQSSGFATQAAFPIVVSNAIGWLAGSGAQSEAAGAPIALAPVKGGWSVTGPDGRVASGLCDEHDSPCSMTDTFTAGVYTARAGSETLLFSRNVDPAASDIVPKEHRLGEASTRELAPGGWKRITWSNIAGWLAALVIAALLLEWWLYHRPPLRALSSPAAR